MTAQLELLARNAVLERLERDNAALLAYLSDRMVTLYRYRLDKYGEGQAFVTADDARRVWNELAVAGMQMPHPNVRGAVFRGSNWQRCGFHVSAAPRGHGNRIFRYRWVG